MIQVTNINRKDWKASYGKMPRTVAPSKEATALYNQVGQQRIDERLIWTELDTDNGVVIANGMFYVNRRAYFLAEKPWDGERGSIEVKD